MAEPTLLDTTEAAAIWRDRSLLADKSLFSDEEIWTIANLRALWVALTEARVDIRRLENLGERLRDADSAVVRLAAELFWVMYLTAGSNCISQARKTDLVRTIYDWSGERLALGHPLLGEVTLSTSAGPGLFFAANRLEELFFLIKAVVGIKKQSTAARRLLLGDALEFGRLLDQAAGDESPLLNQIVRHLLFPDRFEPIFALRDKRRILETFSGIPRRELRRWSVTRLDEELRAVRSQLEPIYDSQTVNFLTEPLLSTWRHGGTGSEIAFSEQRFWIEASPYESRQDRKVGEHALGKALWIPLSSAGPTGSAALMREIEPGDVIFHFTDNAGITAVSVVDGEIDESFTCPGGSPWEGEPGYRLALDAYHEITPMLSQSSLLANPKYDQQLRQQAEKNDGLFFNRQLTLNRVRYLSSAPDGLVKIFNEVYLQQSNRNLPHVKLPEQADLISVESKLTGSTVDHPTAQILYGPTATGKTYLAKARAVEICDSTIPSNQEAMATRYSELVAAGRIRLISMHSAFGYESFMEGQIPHISDSGNDTEASRHVIRPGAFKSMAQLARAAAKPSTPELDPVSARIWKITPKASDGYDDETTYADFLKGDFFACQQALGMDFDGCDTRAKISTVLETQRNVDGDAEELISNLDQLLNKIRTGDWVFLVDREACCRAIGRVSGEYHPSETVDGRIYAQTRGVKWYFKAPSPLPWSGIARKKFLTRVLYRVDWSLLRVPELNELLGSAVSSPQNYVLIIDEIGQGNLIDAFGELITLIDPDVRHHSEGDCVWLPLSGELFSLPANLYLIGTLNMADQLDEAQESIVRRRFEFDEIRPDASLIRGHDQLGTIPDGAGGKIDLRALMLTINERIQLLAGDKHQLGQGLFMRIQSCDDLRRLMRKRIIPHLRQVFGDDWKQIQRVLSDITGSGQANFPQIIAQKKISSSLDQDQNSDPVIDCLYQVNSDRALLPEAFRKIYTEP